MFKPKRVSAPQYDNEEKGSYYKSSEQGVDHPLSRINYCVDFIEKSCCPKGNQCSKRHIYYQQLRKELKNLHYPYKKHLCNTYESKQKCPKSKYLCLFAHGEDDIWNTKFKESKAEQINQNQYDERNKQQHHQKSPAQKIIQQTFAKQAEDDLIQKIIKMKINSRGNDREKQNDNKTKSNDERKSNQDKKQISEKNQQYEKRQKPDNKQNLEKKEKISSKKNQIIFNNIPNAKQGNQELRVMNNQRGQKDQNNKAVLTRNNQRTNKPAQNQDAMNDEEFENYLIFLKEKELMNEQGEDQDSEYDEDEEYEHKDSDDSSSFEQKDQLDDDDEDDEQFEDEDDSNNSSDNNDLFINQKNFQQKGSDKKTSLNSANKTKQNYKKSSKNDEEEWESDEDDDENDNSNKEKKDKIKNESKQTSKKNQDINYNDFKNIDWNKVNPDKMTNEQLMSLHAAYLQQAVDSDDDENNSSKDCDDVKLEEEREKRKQEKKELRKRKKEDKKQQKQQEKEKKQDTQKYQNNQNLNSVSQNQNGNISKESFFQNDQIEIFCFCYFNSEKDLKNWKESLLEVFYELQIPRNALIITEEDRCEGEFGILIKLKSLKVVCLQLLRINLYKNQKLKILFKILPNPDSQISFSKQIIAAKKLNEYSFQGSDGLTYILYNSTIEQSESENLEFKNYDFRNFNENTRKLEEVITGMLNREEFENEEFFKKEELSGRIFLGVKDSTRQFVGSCTTNNHHESFFTFLAKRLRDCQPSIKTSLYQREECRLVIPGESENEFFPIIDMKIFIINVQKPEKKVIYATSSGLYFQKIEEGNWPMSACSLYEKRQKNYISEEKLKLALKQLDRRYFFVMANMANQNALIQSELYNGDNSQY